MIITHKGEPVATGLFNEISEIITVLERKNIIQIVSPKTITNKEIGDRYFFQIAVVNGVGVWVYDYRQGKYINKYAIENILTDKVIDRAPWRKRRVITDYGETRLKSHNIRIQESASMNSIDVHVRDEAHDSVPIEKDLDIRKSVIDKFKI